VSKVLALGYELEGGSIPEVERGTLYLKAIFTNE